MCRSSLKQILRRILASRALLPAWRQVGPSLTAIFALHRFAVPDLGVAGHDPGELAKVLASLRQAKIPILGLDDLLHLREQGHELPARSAIFTVDDGYFDFCDVGAPVFARFDAPVTMFPVTDFLDGACWLWWDQVEYLIHGPEGYASGGRPTRATNGRVPDPLTAQVEAQVERLKGVPDHERRQTLERLAGQFGVTIPETAPACYRPMTWGAVRRLAGGGVTFGPHTRSHPILPRVTDAQCEAEIADAWNRLREELPSAIPVLAYPNGAYGTREVAAVRHAGLSAAVTTESDYLMLPALHDEPYTIPRIAYEDDLSRILLAAAGFRWLRSRVTPISPR